MTLLGYQGLVCMMRTIDALAGIPGTGLHDADDRCRGWDTRDWSAWCERLMPWPGDQELVCERLMPWLGDQELVCMVWMIDAVVGYQGLVCMVRMFDAVAGIPGTSVRGVDDR